MVRCTLITLPIAFSLTDGQTVVHACPFFYEVKVDKEVVMMEVKRYSMVVIVVVVLEMMVVVGSSRC